jgi:hypothetical protein
MGARRSPGYFLTMTFKNEADNVRYENACLNALAVRGYFLQKSFRLHLGAKYGAGEKIFAHDSSQR